MRMLWAGPYDGSVPERIAGAVYLDRSARYLACPPVPQHDAAGALKVQPLGAVELYEWHQERERFEWRGGHTLTESKA